MTEIYGTCTICGQPVLAGQARYTYQGPGGFRYNAYVDPRTGKRQVFRYKA